MRHVPPAELVYRLGDAIRWKQCADGSILPWTYFAQGPLGENANFGDPAFSDLITRDAQRFSWNRPEERLRCPHCSEPLEGAAIEIRDGVIRRSWIYRQGEFPIPTDYMVIDSDGTLKPMLDWDDHPVRLIDSC